MVYQEIPLNEEEKASGQWLGDKRIFYRIVDYDESSES